MIKNATLHKIIKRYRFKISLTAFLVIAEALVYLLFPLFLGYAINGLIEKDYTSLYHLIILGIVSLIIGSGRRFYDTRVYSSIYAELSPEMVEKEKQKGEEVSVITARANLLTELVEFLENSIPQIINNLVGLVGTLVIIFTLNKYVFFASLISFLITFIVYYLSGNYTFKLNKGFNNELERQVKVIEENSKPKIVQHFNQLARWNIRLSDLETLNFGIVWLVMIILLSFSVIQVVDSGPLLFGSIFAIIMYVFEYMNNVIYLPLYYQQLIRLKEISGRIKI